MRYNICILVLLLFVLSGCEKEINLEHMRPEPKLVLNCLAVQGDTPGFMRIIRSKIFLCLVRM